MIAVAAAGHTMLPEEGAAQQCFHATAGRWFYERVPPESSGGSDSPLHGTERQRGIETTARGARSSPSVLSRAVRWAGPVLILLFALFLQNAGLYIGTKVYVRWMDELTAFAERRNHHISTMIGDFRLQDEVRGWLLGEDVVISPASVGPVLVEVLTSLVSITWLGWVARSQNLRLWTRVMLSGAILAALKGLLAWGTVLPDAASWQGCRERLGEDGLAYFRELSDAHIGQGSPLEMFQSGIASWADITMLSIRSVWMMGGVGRHRTCADTVFSAPSCFCLLLIASLFDMMLAATEGMACAKPSDLRKVATLVLGTLLLTDVVLTLYNSHHYTVDITMALPVTLLVYTNPVILVASNRWVDEWSSTWFFAEKVTQAPASSVSHGEEAPLDDIYGAGLRDTENSSTPLHDVGQASVSPFCFPFCCFGGLYHIRQQPGNQPGKPLERLWTPECHARQQEMQASHRHTCDEKAKRQRQLVEEITCVQVRARENEARAAVSHVPRVAQEVRRLTSEAEQQLAEACRRLEVERQAAGALERRVVAELQHFAAVEEEMQELQRERLQEAAHLRWEVAEAHAACMMEQKGIQRYAQEFDALQAISARFHEVTAAAHEDDFKSCKQGEDSIDACKQGGDSIDANFWSPLNKLCDMTAVPAGKVDLGSEEAQREEMEAQKDVSRETVLSSLVAS